MGKHKVSGKLFLFIAFFFLLTSCSEEYLPKPKGFNRIDLPPHKYQEMTETHPYKFSYSAYAKILKDSSYISEPHWIDVYYPQFQSNIQITYKSFKKASTDFDEHIDDSHKLAYKHEIKAYSIDQIQIKTPKGYSATLFELTGEVPSQFQFYVTDSSKHFLRGAVYFKTATRNDSLAPVIEYMKYDVMQMLNSLEWQN
jgi:gliding motility-associated lipoprotein GldD